MDVGGAEVEGVLDDAVGELDDGSGVLADVGFTGGVLADGPVFLADGADDVVEAGGAGLLDQKLIADVFLAGVEADDAFAAEFGDFLGVARSKGLAIASSRISPT